MNRLVEQLLRVARLDAIVLDVTGVADLNEVASGVVATIAPWALARDRTIAFTGFRDPVLVKGNRHAIAGAIRNLVENAVLHSPAWSEVLVRTGPDGALAWQIEDLGSFQLIRNEYSIGSGAERACSLRVPGSAWRS